jgi:hypothetical protein
MGKQSKIRMQEPRVKNSGSKIGNSGHKGRNRGLTRAGRKRQSRRCGERRTRPERTARQGCASPDSRRAVGTIGGMAYDRELAGRIR